MKHLEKSKKILWNAIKKIPIVHVVTQTYSNILKIIKQLQDNVYIACGHFGITWKITVNKFSIKKICIVVITN